MNRVVARVTNITQVLASYDKIKVYRATSEGGSYAEITDANTRLIMIPEQTIYYYDDIDGSSSHWYKTAYFNSVSMLESAQSGARQGGTEAEKIGYTFGNYAPPPGEWGKVYTADDSFSLVRTPYLAK